MKKSILLFLMFLSFAFNFLFKNEVLAQTVSHTIIYGAYTNTCCSGNTTPYTCYGCGPPLCTGCYNPASSVTTTFADPVPAGNVITNVTANYSTIGGASNIIGGSVDGIAVNSDVDGASGSSCSSATWGTTSSSSTNYPCGPTGYNYGGTVTHIITFSGQVCINSVTLVFTYGPATTYGPPIAPGPISGSVSACGGVSGTYSIPATPNTTGYSWTVPAGWTINSGQNTTSINVTTGGSSGNVCVKATNGCGNSPQTCFPVTINPSPTTPVSITGPTSVSCGSTQSYSASVVGATSYNWTVPAGSVINSGQGTGSISVTFGSSSGNICVNETSGSCGTSANFCEPITVSSAPPTPSVPSGAMSVCSGSTQTYTTSAAGATSFNWTVPAGAVINSGQTTASISVTFGSSAGNICVTASNSCGTSAPSCTPTPITVTPLPIATFSYTGTPYCQSGANPSPTFSGGGVAGTFTSSPGGLIIDPVTGVVTLASSPGGTYTVTNTIAASGGCASVVATSNITITTLPVATFSYTGTPYCQNAANPSPTFSGGGVAGTFTSSPAGLIIDPVTGVVTLASSPGGTYTVTNTIGAVGACAAVVATSSITINAAQSSAFSYSATSFCQSATNPIPTITGTPGGIFSSSPATLVFVSTATGEVNLIGSPLNITFTITYTTPGPCAANSSVSLTITNSPSSTFSYSGNVTSFCKTDPNPLPIGNAGVFTASPAGLVFVNPATGEIDLANSAPGNYTLTNTISGGGCATSISTLAITINASPTLTNASTATVCSGTPLNIVLTGSVASGYTWVAADNANTTGESLAIQSTPTINDIITITNPTATSPETVVYTVTLTSTAGSCSNATPQTITVTVDPAPTMTNASTATVCSGTALNIPLTGSISSNPAWVAADNINTTGESLTSQSTATINDIITNPTTSPQIVVYTVTLTSTVGTCINTTPQTVTVTVNPLPTADTSSMVVTTADCGLLTGSVSGITVVSGLPSFTYLWQDALGNPVGTNLNLTGVGPGNYFLTITDANTCSTRIGGGNGITIVPYSSVVAAFTPNPTTGETPLSVSFLNNSTGAVSYLWHFGTGDTSSAVNPTYIYTPLGNFTVCLMASNATGCKDSVCSTIDIYINSTFVIPNVFTPNGDNINDVFAVQNKGLKTMDAEIYNRWGEKMFEWHTTNGGWDGRTTSGVPAPEGTYYFIIKATGLDGKDYFEKGGFTLVR